MGGGLLNSHEGRLSPAGIVGLLCGVAIPASFLLVFIHHVLGLSSPVPGGLKIVEIITDMSPINFKISHSLQLIKYE